MNKLLLNYTQIFILLCKIKFTFFIFVVPDRLSIRKKIVINCKMAISYFSQFSLLKKIQQNNFSSLPLVRRSCKTGVVLSSLSVSSS